MNSSTTTETRAQPWQKMQEVQSLFKPEELNATAHSGSESHADKAEEEPLKLNLFRVNLNASTSNIANVKDE